MIFILEYVHACLKWNYHHLTNNLYTKLKLITIWVDAFSYTCWLSNKRVYLIHSCNEYYTMNSIFINRTYHIINIIYRIHWTTLNDNHSWLSIWMISRKTISFRVVLFRWSILIFNNNSFSLEQLIVYL